MVSVVMPTFNSERYVGAAIESVQRQVFTDWELLVTDGGSRDGTRALVERVAAADPRVRLVPNPDDRGPAHARATGVRHSRGEYVAFLDGDDLWMPTKLSEQIAFMRASGTDFSYTQYRPMNAEGTQTSCALSAYRQYSFWSALARRGIGTLTVVARRSLLTEEVLATYGKSHGEEYLWWLMILRGGVTARGLLKPLALYRNTEGSLSKRRLRHQSTVWHTYRNEMALSAPVAALVYVSYVFDVAQRRLRSALCTRLRGPAAVAEVLA
jgi:teichuronic acid biosynthesis glycosyltransferase TuaG